MVSDADHGEGVKKRQKKTITKTKTVAVKTVKTETSYSEIYFVCVTAAGEFTFGSNNIHL